MTLTEFRAWLDGYSEAIGEAPTPEQWAKIREKLDTVCGPAQPPRNYGMDTELFKPSVAFPVEKAADFSITTYYNGMFTSPLIIGRA